MYSSVFLAFSALVASVATGAVVCPGKGSPWSTVKDHRVVYQFNNGTQVENIAVRSNGNLLVTLSDRPELYEVNPFDCKGAKLVHRFSEYLGLSGIAEVTPDVFTVNVGNFSFETGPLPNQWAVWQVAFHNDQAAVSKVTDLPEALLPNGMTTLGSTPDTVLIADSAAGVIYSLNIKTKKYETVLENEAFKPAPTAPLPIGINGLKYFDHYVYYTNSFNPLFGRVPVCNSGRAIGSYKTIVAGVVGDDFVITPQAAYVAGNPTNVLNEVKLDGQHQVIAGNLNSSLIAGDTSVAFGRTIRDKHVLYVTTDGASLSPVNGTFTEGGKIVALEI